MNNRIIWATLAGGIASYLLGWLIYGIVLAENTSMYGSATGVAKTDMGDMWALILGNISGAYLLAHIWLIPLLTGYSTQIMSPLLKKSRYLRQLTPRQNVHPTVFSTPASHHAAVPR